MVADRVLEDLHAGLDRAASLDFGALDDVELDGAVVDFAAVRARLDALETRAVARLQDWLDEHDPDGPEPDGKAHRRVHCSKTSGDAWRLEGWLDPVAGSVFATELDRLERRPFETDWADAKDRLGHDPLLHDLGRTSGQRRADALVLMAERSATLPEDGRRGAPLFTVLAGHDSLRRILELTNGTQLRPAQVAEHLDPAWIELAIFDTPTHVVGISRQRTFRGIVRKAVQLAHRRCAHPSCDEPIDACQVDHVLEAARDGVTDQTNGRLLCGHHNRLRNQARPTAGRHDRAPPRPAA